MRAYVRSPARLHFGFLDLCGNLGRVYIGLGLAINKPKVRIVGENSDKIIITGNDSERAESFVKQLFKLYAISGGLSLTLEEVIPRHIGLGSTTQLSLSIALLVKTLCGLSASIDDIALRLGRGRVSGIGIAVFKYGGFIVDSGRLLLDKDNIPRPIFRLEFPENWRFLIVIPGVRRGFTEEEESFFFDQFEKTVASRGKGIILMSEKTSNKLCRIALVKLIPAIVDKDIVAFGEALTEIQEKVGKFFSQIQGGIFRGEVLEKFAKLLLRHGAFGVGQSSWGPTIYGIYESEKEAKQAYDALYPHLEKIGGKMFTAFANNRGAELRFC